MKKGDDRVEGKIYKVTYECRSYEISVIIDRDFGTYKIDLNGTFQEKGRLKPSKRYLCFPMELDGHRFLTVIRRYKDNFLAGEDATTYEVDCFADGISMSVEKSTFKDYYEKTKKKPQRQCSPKNIWKSVCANAACVILFASLLLILRLVQKISWDIILQDVAIVIGVDLFLVIPISLLSNWLDRRELHKHLIQM